MKPASSKIIKYQSGNLILKSVDDIGPLILGDCNSAMDKKIQKQFKIQTVISIGQQAMPIKEKLPENCKHHFYDIHDNKSQKVSAQLFDEINNLIEEGRKNGGVLVHCYAGVSRSSTFVIAYIMQKFLKTYDDAKQQVKNARSCIYPNDGFVHQLKSYQKVLELRQQERLRKIQEQKNRLIEQSLVQSARKSIRGGVRGAAMSPQKVKQINEQRHKKSFELFIEPLASNQQIKTIKQQKESDEIAKIKNNPYNFVSSLKKDSKKKQKVVPSRSIFLTKSFSISQKPKQDIKLPKVKQSSHTERAKIQNKKSENRYIKQDINNKVQKQIQKKSQSISLFVKKQKQEQKIDRDDSSKISSQSKTKTHTTMRQSKSIINNKRQKQHISQIDQSLLNDHQKKIKKIYQTKIVVK